MLIEKKKKYNALSKKEKYLTRQKIIQGNQNTFG